MAELNLPLPGDSPNWGNRLNAQIEHTHEVAHDALGAVDGVAYEGGSLQGMREFDDLSYVNQVVRATDVGFPRIGYPFVLSNTDGFIPGGVQYYGMFSTDHAGGGTAPGLLVCEFNQHGDPWTSPTSMVNRGGQLETPWVVKDPAHNRLILYGHGPGLEPGQIANQVTACWTTTPARFANNHSDWDYQGLSHEWDSRHSGFLTGSNADASAHCGYQKPINIGGAYFSYGQATGGNNMSFRDTWISLDGLKYWRLYRPSKNQIDVNDYSADKRVLLDHLFEWGGNPWGVGRIRETGTSGTGSGSGTLMVIARMRDDLGGFVGRPQTIFSPPGSGNGHNGDIRGLHLLVENSEMHLYYGSDVTSLNYAKVSI